MKKAEVIALLEKEINFAKQCGMPQFTLGMIQAKDVIEREWKEDDKPIR